MHMFLHPACCQSRSDWLCPCRNTGHPHHSPHPSTFANDKKLQEAAYVPADRLPPVQPPQLTVFLVSQLQNHVLLSQFMVGLLQVFNVIDGFAQDTRLVHLQGIQISRTQFILQAPKGPLMLITVPQPFIS